MLLALLLAVQQPQAQARLPCARVEVTPAPAEIQVGQPVKLDGPRARRFGNPVPGATLRYLDFGDGGSVDSTGS